MIDVIKEMKKELLKEITSDDRFISDDSVVESNKKIDYIEDNLTEAIKEYNKKNMFKILVGICRKEKVVNRFTIIDEIHV